MKLFISVRPLLPLLSALMQNSNSLLPHSTFSIIKQTLKFPFSRLILRTEMALVLYGHLCVFCVRRNFSRILAVLFLWDKPCFGIQPSPWLTSPLRTRFLVSLSLFGQSQILSQDSVWMLRNRCTEESLNVDGAMSYHQSFSWDQTHSHWGLCVCVLWGAWSICIPIFILFILKTYINLCDTWCAHGHVKFYLLRRAWTGLL